MGGRHEPPTRSSFYVSLLVKMSTAALRGILVVAAVALGVFVIVKAFPTGSSSAPIQDEAPAGDDGTTETTPPDDGQQDSPPAQGNGEPVVEGITVQVLNGTDVSGLAETTKDRVEALGYADVLFADAVRDQEQTSVNYTRDAQADAEFLQQELFPRAELIPVAAGAAEFDITVILGADYADEAG